MKLLGLRCWVCLFVTAVASVFLAAAGGAGVSATVISIRIHTPYPPARGLTVTAYGQTATVSGRTRQRQAGDVVELQASKFPFHSGFIPVGQGRTGRGGSYAFVVRPTIATHYRVVRASDAKSRSPVVSVYVSPRWINRTTDSCHVAPRCHLHLRAEIVYPPSSAAREAARRVYDYFAVRYGSATIPPRRVQLVNTESQRLIGNRAWAGFSVKFPTVKAFHYRWFFCAKDIEARTGVGLPGRSSCGDPSITGHSYLR